jgi:hypothetical protein
MAADKVTAGRGLSSSPDARNQLERPYRRSIWIPDRAKTLLPA